MAGVSLLESFAAVPDPRDRQGRRHPLTAVLGLTVVAILAGMKSLEAIAQFGRDHGPSLAHALGFRRGKTPCKATLSYLFRDLDVAAFEEAIRRWLLARLAGGWDVIAIDGKTLCGSRAGPTPGVHLLAAYAPQAAAVLGQLRVDAKTNEHKAALTLLGILPPLEGAVVTADAMFTHRDFCEAVRRRGGDYVLPVKDNQATLQSDIAAVFATLADFSPYQQRLKAAREETVTECRKGHGRHERRTLTRTTALNDYLDWPDVGQVFRLERIRTIGTRVTVETVYGITSLTTDQADAADLLNLVRTHWAIENQLHYVRDVTLGEDASRVRSGSAPQILAALRNTALHLLKTVAAASKAAALRFFAAHPRIAVKLVTAKEPEN